MIGTVDDARVFSAAHPGAVYLHQGRQYRVAKLDMEEHVAWMEPYDDTDEYTQARTETDITIVKEDAFAPLGEAIVHLGDVEVHTQVVGYQRKQVSTNDVIETVPLDLPARTLVTRACWYTVPARSGRSHGYQHRASSSARCTRPSTASLGCCRCSRSATVGMSAACRWR